MAAVEERSKGERRRRGKEKSKRREEEKEEPLATRTIRDWWLEQDAYKRRSIKKERKS